MDLRTEVRSVDGRRRSSLLEEAETLLDRSTELLENAYASGDNRLAIAGVREARGCLELLAKFRLAALATVAHRVPVEPSEVPDAAIAIICDVLSHWHTVALRIAPRLDDRSATLRRALVEALPESIMRQDEHQALAAYDRRIVGDDDDRRPHGGGANTSGTKIVGVLCQENGDLPRLTHPPR